MTREDVKQLLAVISVTYPNFKVSDMKTTVDVWTMLLSDFSNEEITLSLKKYIMTDTSGFAPVISQLIAGTKTMESINANVLNETEAWALVRKAICNGNYHAQEEFDKLPKIVQKAVGSPDNIRNWAQTDLKSLDTVIASNFTRVYKSELEQSAKTISNQLALGQMSNLQIEGA